MSGYHGGLEGIVDAVVVAAAVVVVGVAAVVVVVDRRRSSSSSTVAVVDRRCRRRRRQDVTSVVQSGQYTFSLVSRAGVRVVKVPATEATGVAGEGKAGAAGQSCRKAFRGVWLRDEGLWSTRVGARERGTLHTRSGYTHQEARAGLRSVV